jgi:hypothetical protein
MKPMNDADREQVICLGAAAVVFGMIASGRVAPKDQDIDAMMENAFTLAERFVAKVEARLANK